MDNGNGITDQRIMRYDPLVSPYQLKQDIPSSDLAKETVRLGRQGIGRILNRDDPRKLIIVGPCSIHDPESAMEYASRNKELADVVSDKLLIVQRMYFEKPRTSLGWQGLIMDPDMNETGDLNKGFRLSRELLSYVAELGLPAATEYLDPITPQFNGDFISYAVIGARTAYSQPHRNLASGLSMPVGFKNDTHGDISVAVNGALTSRRSHSFPGVDEHLMVSIVKTTGNSDTHVILRGGGGTTNYDEGNVRYAQSLLEKAGLPPIVVIDCSHDNTLNDQGVKEYERQEIAFEDVTKQIKEGNEGIIGIMFESHINAGSQSIKSDLTGFDPSTLKYGLSVTDGCLDLETTRLLILDFYKTL
ncbi:MAG: 3-deoxy-7-phosphoheptulonate synthase [Nanoarchaeota archaeon]|nr:3-deoxy-7-phosphoheptulonate synthase [Nanoarchaeota archaeon]